MICNIQNEQGIWPQNRPDTGKTTVFLFPWQPPAGCVPVHNLVQFSMPSPFEPVRLSLNIFSLFLLQHLLLSTPEFLHSWSETEQKHSGFN